MGKQSSRSLVKVFRKMDVKVMLNAKSQQRENFNRYNPCYYRVPTDRW